MLYSILLVSTKHQHEFVIGLSVFPPNWTSLPPPSASHLSGLLPSPSFEFPESYSKLPMASYFTYGNIWCIFPSCYSLRTSHPLLPPHPSSHVRKSVLYVCVSIAALQIGLLVSSLIIQQTFNVYCRPELDLILFVHRWQYFCFSWKIHSLAKWIIMLIDNHSIFISHLFWNEDLRWLSYIWEKIKEDV